MLIEKGDITLKNNYPILFGFNDDYSRIIQIFTYFVN